jgi:hypothetical protein
MVALCLLSNSMRESVGKSGVNTKDEAKVKLKLINVTSGVRQYHGFCGGVLVCCVSGTMFAGRK